MVHLGAARLGNSLILNQQHGGIFYLSKHKLLNSDIKKLQNKKAKILFLIKKYP